MGCKFEPPSLTSHTDHRHESGIFPPPLFSGTGFSMVPSPKKIRKKMAAAKNKRQ
jgi:hypothetical protein